MTKGEWLQFFSQGHVIRAQILISLLLIWSLVWKGIALWKAARNSAKGWYVVMLILNTVGILEILYTFVFSRPIKKVE